MQDGYMTACFTALTQSHSQLTTVKKKKEKGAGKVYDCMFHSAHTHRKRLGNGRRKRVQEGYMTACFKALTLSRSQYNDCEIEEGKECKKGI